MKPEESLIITTLLQAYWISLLLFKLPFIPLIIILSIISLIIYVIIQKYYNLKNEYTCKKLPISKEILLHFFFFGSRTIIAIMTILYSLSVVKVDLILTSIEIYSNQLFTNTNIELFIIAALGGLGWIDTELSTVWCFHPTFRIIEEVLNIMIVYFYILF